MKVLYFILEEILKLNDISRRQHKIRRSLATGKARAVAHGPVGHGPKGQAEHTGPAKEHHREVGEAAKRRRPAKQGRRRFPKSMTGQHYCNSVFVKRN